MDGQERRLVRLQERRRAGRQQVRSRQAPSGRRDGRDRPLFRRRQGHPPRLRPAPADQGSRSRRRRCRGDLRHPGRVEPAQRQGCLERDAAHLQRLAKRFLQLLSRPAYRPRLPALWRHRRRGAGDLSRRQARPARAGALLLVGHGADVASDVGAAVEGGERRAACRCTSTPSRRCRPTPSRSMAAGSDARCSSPSCRASR